MNEDMNIVIVGHVDHGKSTIIGRLLADTNSLSKGKLERIKEICKKNSKPFEYAFLVDVLKEERSQGITIDTSRCFFKTSKRNYTLIDAPGHLEFLKNMITGASRADAALLVVDAKEGIKENSKRHIHVLSLLGIKQIAVLINKMDLVNYDCNMYINIMQELKDFFEKLKINAEEFIPISGMNGDNIASKSQYMHWYNGKTVLEVLDNFKNDKKIYDKPFRMFVQDVYKFTQNSDERRIIAGTIETGKLSIGDEIIFYPSEKTGKVKSIESFNQEKIFNVKAGYSIGITLEEQIYISRGEVAALKNESKMNVTTRIYTTLFWLSNKSMEKSKKYFIKIGTSKVGVVLEELIKTISSCTLEEIKKEKIEKNDVAKCILRLDKPIAFDVFYEIYQTGRFVILDDYIISGGGIIQKSLEDKNVLNNIVWHEGKITYENRCDALGQRGLVVWFTGLSGAGKSTIAAELENELLKRGKFVYRLDSDNLRYGLNCDLGFSKADRNENVRRIAEVAQLFKDAGLIVLVSSISPYKSMREFAKQKIGKDDFIEIYVKADIEICMKRDPKGLYKKVEVGEIEEFTGITSVYEIPENPDLVIDTEKLSIELALNKILDRIISR